MYSIYLLYCAVISCGWLSPPNNGKKEGTIYLQGATVQLSCDDGYTLEGSAERTCQANGQWSGEDTNCVVPSMNKLWNQSCPLILIFTNQQCQMCECLYLSMHVCVCIIWSIKSALKCWNAQKIKSLSWSFYINIYVSDNYLYNKTIDSNRNAHIKLEIQRT